jgi:dTDP-4-amino-4,6-dideoxygalactose transaminase
MSAINIPDMLTVARHHGLIPVPVDLHLDSLAPKLDILEKGITKDTAAILVAHLYGKRFDMAPIVAIGKKYKVPVIEDAAEGFSGWDYLGHPEADLVLFSFGSMKVATAYGGGMAVVRDSLIHREMVDIHNKYSIHSTQEYFKKLLKGTVVMMILNVNWFCGVVQGTSQAVGYDIWETVVSLLRGFSGDLIPRLRQQPSTPMLSTLATRLDTFDRQLFLLNTKKGDMMIDLLPDKGRGVVHVPGIDAVTRNYWLYPVLLTDPSLNPEEVILRLRTKGVFAVRSSTQLRLVPPPPELNQPITAPPEEAKLLMDKVLYLPVHRRTPWPALAKLGEALEQVINELSPPSKKSSVKKTNTKITPSSSKPSSQISPPPPPIAPPRSKL